MTAWAKKTRSIDLRCRSHAHRNCHLPDHNVREVADSRVTNIGVARRSWQGALFLLMLQLPRPNSCRRASFIGSCPKPIFGRILGYDQLLRKLLDHAAAVLFLTDLILTVQNFSQLTHMCQMVRICWKESRWNIYPTLLSKRSREAVNNTGPISLWVQTSAGEPSGQSSLRLHYGGWAT